MSDLDEDYFSTADGATIWFSLQGKEGPVLVLCDGLGCDGFVWKYLSARFSSTYRLLRFHHRGHGHSTTAHDPTRLGVEYSADDLEGIMSAAGIDRATILGHSMGFQVALELFRRHRNRVEGLIAICGAFGRALDGIHNGTKAKALLNRVHQLAEAHPSIARTVARHLLDSSFAMQYALSMEVNRSLIRTEDFRPYFTHLASMDPLNFFRTMQSAALHSAWDYLSEIDVPTLIVAGERDQFTPLWVVRKMHENIPGSEFFVVPSGSHAAPIELPELISDRIARFLEERSLAS